MPALSQRGMWQPGSASRACRRALTLLELLVVLAILVALASLSIPIGLWQLRESQRSQVESRVESAIIQARARAQRLGCVVRVIAMRDGANSDTVRTRGEWVITAVDVPVTGGPEDARELEDAAPQPDVTTPTELAALPARDDLDIFDGQTLAELIERHAATGTAFDEPCSDHRRG
jgi:prepilin-type N-terminal cleavage/methylation domain-containing protein